MGTKLNIAVLTVTFNEPDFIIPCVRQFDEFDFTHLVLVGKKSWHGDYVMDETWAKAKMVLPSSNVIIDEWASCADQFNAGMQILEEKGFDWILIVDTDEFYTPVSIGQLISQMRNTNADIIRAPYMNVYWKTPDYMIIPAQRDNPVVAARSNVRFDYIRTPAGNVNQEMFMNVMYHMSYVRSDEAMWKKINCFEHQHEFDKKAWYENVWLKWTEDMENLHPVVPMQFRKAIKYPVHPDVARLLNA